MLAELSYSGPATGALAEQDWVIAQQRDIPQSQQICTVNDLRSMMSMASVGLPASSYTSDSCPITRRAGPGGSVIASCRIEILIHRSVSLAGAYDMIPSEGKLSIGQLAYLSWSKPYDLNYEATTQLGWLPASTPRYAWLTKVKNADKIRVFAPQISSQLNGFVYFAEAYRGTVQVSGTAVVDRYYLTIEHQQGYKFDKTILLTVEYGPADINGQRKSVRLDVKLPQCAIDEFNKCAGNEFSLFGKINNGDGADKWNVFYGPWTWEVSIGGCSGDILKDEKIYQ